MAIAKEELVKRIERCEKEKDFFYHVEPIDYSNMVKVTPDYQYIRKDLYIKCYEKFARGLAITIGLFTNHFVMGMKVKGRKNLRGIKSAIFTCNHVNNVDCMMVREVVFGHKLYVAVGEFNNMNGFFGSLLRAGGTLPFSDNIACMINLKKAISTLLSTNNYILFYPEEALWWRYEKPRSYRNGAFYYATVNNAPIVPIFITFEEPIGIKRLYIKQKIAILNIMQPIYSKADLTKKESIEYLKNKNFEMCKDKYEEFYGIKLEY